VVVMGGGLLETAAGDTVAGANLPGRLWWWLRLFLFLWGVDVPEAEVGWVRVDARVEGAVWLVHCGEVEVVRCI